MSETLVTVVIPVYNGEKFLEETILSAVNSQHRPLEIIVVNDGSTDDTEQLLVDLVARHEGRLRTVTRTNSGPAATRNFGVKNTSGEYLIFLDADDAFSDDALSLLREVIQDNPGLGMAVGGHISVSSNGEEKLIQSSLSLLGFTPSDRSKLGVAEVKAKSKLEELMERRANREDARG